MQLKLSQAEHLTGYNDGVHAFLDARSKGKTVIEAVATFFDAEPEAKKVVFAKTKTRPLERKSITETVNIIRLEEEKFIALLDRANKIVKKMFKDESEITGENLAFLHHTHGYDPTIVEGVFDCHFPSSMHDAYLEAMEIHKSKS